MSRVASRDAHRCIGTGKLGGHSEFTAGDHAGYPAP